MPKNYRLVVDIDRIQAMSLGDALALVQLVEAQQGLHEIAREASPDGGLEHNQIIDQLAIVLNLAEKRVLEVKRLYFKIVDESGKDYTDNWI